MSSTKIIFMVAAPALALILLTWACVAPEPYEDSPCDWPFVDADCDGDCDSDDDGPDDDDDDDDAGDDDDDSTADPNAPILSTAFWMPNPAEQNPRDEWSSILTFSVCDPDDDLAGGTLSLSFSEELLNMVWTDGVQWETLLGDPPSAPNCTTGHEVSIEVIFDILGNGFKDLVCVDIEGTDGAGNKSNRLEDVCVYVSVSF